MAAISSVIIQQTAELYQSPLFIGAQVVHVIVSICTIGVVIYAIFFEAAMKLLIESRKYSVFVLYICFGIHASAKCLANIIHLYVAFTWKNPEEIMHKNSFCIWFRYPIQVVEAVIWNLYYVTYEDMSELLPTCTAMSLNLQNIIPAQYLIMFIIVVCQSIMFISLYVHMSMKMKRRTWDLSSTFEYRQKLYTIRLFVPLFTINILCAVITSIANMYLRPRYSQFTEKTYRSILEVIYLYSFFNLASSLLLLWMNRKTLATRQKENLRRIAPIANDAQLYFERLRRDWNVQD